MRIIRTFGIVLTLCLLAGAPAPAAVVAQQTASGPGQRSHQRGEAMAIHGGHEGQRPGARPCNHSIDVQPDGSDAWPDRITGDLARQVGLNCEAWARRRLAFSTLPLENDATIRSLLDGFHVWSFVTTEDDQMLQVSCSVLLRKNTAADAAAAETRLAGGMFVEMLKRMSFAHVP